jgi:filamentous hemagglutinin
LIFGQGSRQGNRVLHVLEHLAPNSAKPLHTVFNVGRTELLGLLDEAWLARGAPLADDAGAYIVNMGRTIGTAGEQSVKFIVRPGTSELITAFPVP